MITAYIDFKSLDCYLAIAPVVELAKAFGVEIDWQPFQTRERPLPTQVANENITQGHHRVRAACELRLNLQYAKRRGLDINSERAQIDTREALAWLNKIEGDKTEFVLRAFDAHWRQEQDLNDPELLNKMITACNLSLNDSVVDLDRSHSDAEQAGLFDAPTFVIEGQLFVGRAHIPWMRQQLMALQD